MKILIVEDVESFAQQMAEIAKEFGEVQVISTTRHPRSRFNLLMPAFDQAVEMVNDADIILLDYDLMFSYTGEDLYPHCEGKKVIGISSICSFGEVEWSHKGNSPDRPNDADEQLRECFRQVLA